MENKFYIVKQKDLFIKNVKCKMYKTNEGEVIKLIGINSVELSKCLDEANIMPLGLAKSIINEIGGDLYEVNLIKIDTI